MYDVYTTVALWIAMCAALTLVLEVFALICEVPRVAQWLDNVLELLDY
jgi:hypothetical protein